MSVSRTNAMGGPGARPLVGAPRVRKPLCPNHESVVGRASSLPSGRFARKDLWGLEARPTSGHRFMSPVHVPEQMEASHEPRPLGVQPFVAGATKGCHMRFMVQRRFNQLDLNTLHKTEGTRPRPQQCWTHFRLGGSGRSAPTGHPPDPAFSTCRGDSNAPGNWSPPCPRR